jgi:uncharacterized membrane protein
VTPPGRCGIEAPERRSPGALWPLPTAAILLAIGLGIGLPVLDEVLDSGHEPLTLVFEGGPSARAASSRRSPGRSSRW